MIRYRKSSEPSAWSTQGRRGLIKRIRTVSPLTDSIPSQLSYVPGSTSVNGKVSADVGGEQRAAHFEVRDQALLAHATQIDPGGFWFACPIEVQQAAWPTEDYHLARSVVDTEIPEDDLFAGARERVSL